MPRYIYQCNVCDEINSVFHGIDEIHTVCMHCDSVDCLTKMLTKPTFKNKIASSDKEKVGKITNKYIEDNKKILDDMKKECKETTYEPS